MMIDEQIDLLSQMGYDVVNDVSDGFIQVSFVTRCGWVASTRINPQLFFSNRGIVEVVRNINEVIRRDFR